MKPGEVCDDLGVQSDAQTEEFKGTAPSYVGVVVPDEPLAESQDEFDDILQGSEIKNSDYVQTLQANAFIADYAAGGTEVTSDRLSRWQHIANTAYHKTKPEGLLIGQWRQVGTNLMPTVEEHGLDVV